MSRKSIISQPGTTLALEATAGLIPGSAEATGGNRISPHCKSVVLQYAERFGEVHLPQFLLTGPYFPVMAQPSWSHTNQKQGYTIETGVPWDSASAEGQVPWTQYHFDVLLAVYSLHTNWPYAEEGTIRTSYGEINRILSGFQPVALGGQYTVKKIQGALTDLQQRRLRITFEKGPRTGEREFLNIPVMTLTTGAALSWKGKPLSLKGAENALQIHEIQISEAFRDFCGQSPLLPFSLKHYFSLHSPIARAIYHYIPSRLQHHDSPTDAWTITPKKLLEQMGHSGAKHDWLAWATLNRGYGPAGQQRTPLEELDGIPVRGKTRLRCTVVPAKEGGRLIAFWLDKDAAYRAEEEQSELYRLWKESGKPRGIYFERLRTYTRLTGVDYDLLNRAGVYEIDPYLPLYVKMKSLLGETEFHCTLGQLASDIRERRVAPVSTERLLTSYLKTAIVRMGVRG